MRIPENTDWSPVEINETALVFPAVFTAEMFNADLLEGIISPEVLAKKCNQTLKEDLRNNFGSLWKRVVAKGESFPSTQEDFEAYISSYIPNAIGGGRGTTKDKALALSPIEVEARRLIRIDLRAALKSQKKITIAKRGVDPVGKQISYERFLEMVEAVLVDNPSYLSRAEANVSARKDLLVIADDDE